jgi:hypothetical protein
VDDPMKEVLDAYQALRETERRAAEMILAARIEFGRAMYEARHLPPHKGRVKQETIAIEVDLKGERLRQIEKLYRDTLAA